MIKLPFDCADSEKTEIRTIIRQIDIPAIIARVKEKKRVVFDLKKQSKYISHLLDKPLEPEESARFLSSKDGFSSIAFIQYVAELEPIEELSVSTFRIGLKQAEIMAKMAKNGRIKNAFFVTGRMKDIQSDRYNYFTQINAIFDEVGFKLAELSNHSKIFLMRTKNYNFVLETSSNLNENPSIEQFCFSNSKALYDFYHPLFEELKNDEKHSD